MFKQYLPPEGFKISSIVKRWKGRGS